MVMALACGTGGTQTASSPSRAQVKYRWEPGSCFQTCGGLLTVGKFSKDYECTIQVIDPVLGPRPLRWMPLKTDVTWEDSAGLDGTRGTTETIRLTGGGGIIEVVVFETAGSFSIIPSSWIALKLVPRTASRTPETPDEIRIDFGPDRGVLTVFTQPDANAVSPAWYWRLGSDREFVGPFASQIDAVHNARIKSGFSWPATIIEQLRQSGVRIDDRVRE